MGVLRFQVTSPDISARLPDLRKAYFTGLDRIPMRMSVEYRQGVLSCHRESSESGKLFVPWPVPGQGTPIVGTATLAERREPYHLAVELARGKLNDLRNQLSDWRQLGLQTTPEFDQLLKEAQHWFVKAAVGSDDQTASFQAAQSSLTAAWGAGERLVESYTSQILQARLASTPKLTTQLTGVVEGDPRSAFWAENWRSTFNAARVGLPWRSIAPSEGLYQWDILDAQIQWCKKNQIAIQAGPLLEFRPSALPDWIWLWEGDFETILGLVVDYVRSVVSRYKGKVPLWHLLHRPACADFLGLSEDEQIRIATRAIQVARQADPSAQFTVGVDRPWAEWMGDGSYQLGPLYLADYLVRADLGLSGIAIEVAPGYSSPGSHLRDLLEFSKLLDLYAHLNLPLHIWMSFPSSISTDSQADPNIRVEAGQWASFPDEMTQATWGAKWLALAVAKPFVRSVSWSQIADGNKHLYPNGGLYNPLGAEKPLLGWIKAFREEIFI